MDGVGWLEGRLSESDHSRMQVEQPAASNAPNVDETPMNVSSTMAAVSETWSD